MITEFMNFFKDNSMAFTSIGVLITFFVSSISLFFSIKNNKASYYMNAVTKSRIDWIQQLRNTVAEFIANTNIYNNAYYKNDYEKTGIHLSKCQKLNSEIKLLLNCYDEKDKEIVRLSDKILEAYRKYCDSVHHCKVNDSGYFVDTPKMKELKNEVEDTINVLSSKVQIYLKSEWNRIKYESKGKIYEKETQEFDYIELENRYETPSYKNRIWKRFWINFIAKLKRKIVSPRFVIFVSAIIILILIFIFIEQK
jgi:hypothetical protein